MVEPVNFKSNEYATACTRSVSAYSRDGEPVIVRVSGK